MTEQLILLLKSSKYQHSVIIRKHHGITLTYQVSKPTRAFTLFLKFPSISNDTKVRECKMTLHVVTYLLSNYCNLKLQKL